MSTTEDPRQFCQRCGSLDNPRMFSMSAGKWISGRARLCEPCTTTVARAVKSLLANQPVSVEPATVVPIPPMPEFPEDSGDEPRFRDGAQVELIARCDPRTADGRRGVVPEFPAGRAVVAGAHRPGPLGDRAVWVYRVTVDDPDGGEPRQLLGLTAYQLRAQIQEGATLTDPN